MTFEEKLSTILLTIKDVYGLDDNNINIIRENIVNRKNIYGNIEIKKISNEPSIFKNESELENILLNRLINNIRDYEFDDKYSLENTTKGEYISARQKFYLADPRFIMIKVKDKLKDRIPNVSNEMLDKCYKKVFNHEIGHALQTGLTSNNGINNDKYKEIVDRLYKINPNEFNNISIMNNNMTTSNKGMIPKRKEDQFANIRNYYSPMAFTTNLDEIFNEEEALVVTNITKPQLKYDMGQGYIKNIYNYDSSNYRITSYATFMKIIMGKEITFDSMYIDSIEAYRFFDTFQNISNTTFIGSKYEGKPPMLNILNALEEIKSNKSLSETTKLESFLTQCYYLKINNELKNETITPERSNEILQEISQLKSIMVNNPNQKLNYQVKLEELENNVKTVYNKEMVSNETLSIKKDLSQTNNVKVSSFLHHPKSKELNELEKQKQIALSTNDLSKYNLLNQEIKDIICNNRMTIDQNQWDNLSVNDKIKYVSIKAQESKILNDEDEFNYWNSNSKSLQEQERIQEKENNNKNNSTLLNNKEWYHNYKNMSEPELFNLIINNIHRVPKDYPNPVALNDYIAIEDMTYEYIKKYSSPKNISKFINSMKSLDRNTTNKKMFECVGNMIKEEIRKHKKDNTKINSIDDIENIIKNTTKPLDRNGKEYKDLVANIRSYIINNKDNLNFDKVYMQIKRIELTVENLELIVDTMTVINEQKEKLKKQEKTDIKEIIRKEDNSNFIKKTTQYLIDLKEIKNFSPNNLEDILFRLKRIKKEFDELDKETLRNNYDLYEEVENYIRKTNNKLEEITTLNRKMGF